VSVVQALLREDLRDFSGYASARRSAATGSIWLNANESAESNVADPRGSVRRYPEPQPAALRTALASLYEVAPDSVLLSRGSDEAIDLLVRAFCRPQQDAVVIAPPVFGMYAVSARLQGARLIEVPLLDESSGFRPDLGAVARAALEGRAKLVFLCSPANPTGEALTIDEIKSLLRALNGQVLLVLDEAYGEYCDEPSATHLLHDHPNLVVLKTLSKAHALAAARVGCLIATPELVSVLRNCQAPYPLPTPSVELALAALAPDSLATTRQRVAQCRSERGRLHQALLRSEHLTRVYASQGNYLLVRCRDADDALARLQAQGVVVRDMRAMPQLQDAIRISVGSPDENDAVMLALIAGVPC